MRIALVDTSANNLLLFRRELIRELIELKHEVYALAIDYTPAYRNEVAALGAHPVDYRLNRAGMNLFEDVAHCIKLYKLLKRLGPDIILLRAVKPVIYGAIVSRLAGIPKRIGMLEGLGYSFTEFPSGVDFKKKITKRIQIALYKLSIPNLSKLLFLNHDDPIDLVQRYHIKVKECIVLGPIGLSLRDYSYSPPFVKKIVFIFVARLLAEKGVREFIAAARLVKWKGADAHFVAVGGIDSVNPSSLTEKEFAALREEGLIEFPGHVDNVADWMRQSSVFVLPSYYREGVPRSTQEAMAIGRPVITTDVPGCRESIVDGVNGFLVPPWNVERLAERMMYFVDNPQRIIEMGQKAHEYAVEYFDAKKINPRLIEIMAC